MVIAPLVVARQAVGLITLVATDRTRRNDDEHLALAGELGQRLGTMVAAERLAHRQRQLYDISIALSAAGTTAEAASVASTGLRTVLAANVVTVAQLGNDGLLHLAGTVGYPRHKLGTFATVRLSAPFPLSEAARTGRPVWLSDREAWLARYPGIEASLQPETQGAAALPLLVGDRVVGAVGVTFTTARRFDPEERSFLLTVAGQVAVAVERAALADARRVMADTLQRSLLPGALPDVERLAVTARYVPAVEGTQAGGDWYDVLPVDQGRLAVVVGDVVGNGAPAAAVMGQLRSALAALLLEGHGPARALELLDSFVAHVPGARVSTVACLLLDPATGRLVHSCAGHPPPLVVDVDGARYLDGGLGPALGVTAAGPRPEAVTSLAPGALFVLYTDGLVERRDAALDEGLDRLATVATVLRDAPLPEFVDGLLTGLADHDGAADDIAVVAGRLLAAPLHLELPAAPAQLRALRRSLQQWTAEAGIGAAVADDLQLAVGEAVANAVEHAYGDRWSPGLAVLDIRPESAGTLEVTVADSGAWRPVPSDPGFRGRGLQIIRSLAIDVELIPGADGTRLRFRMAGAWPAETTPSSAVAGPRPATRLTDERPAAVVTSEHDGRRCIELRGDLDLAGVPAVREPLLAALADPAPVILDLTGIGHLASVGIALLLDVVVQVGAGGAPEVVLPESGAARRMLDLTGLTPVLLDRPATG